MARTVASGRTKPIFISYRRADTSGFAGRLYDDLVDQFGREHVFRDLKQIAPGRPFLEVIDEAVGSCAAMLVVIGREWLGCTDATGRPRLEDPDDVVRREVRAALARDVLVIPVLVEDVEMPSRARLPEELRELASLQAIKLTDSHWDHDIAVLTATIGAMPGAPKRRRLVERRRWIIPLAAISLVLVLGLTIVKYALGEKPDLKGVFTFAIARFGEVRADGKVVGSSVASKVSELFYAAVKAKSGVDEQASRLIDRLDGTTVEKRNASALAHASDIDAHLVLSGLLEEEEGASVVTLELFVGGRPLDGAPEITGRHQLGPPISVAGRADRAEVVSDLVTLLAERGHIVAEVILGLRSYTTGQNKIALGHFQEAEKNWNFDDGKEVLYLLLGNVAGRLHDLAGARKYYNDALGLKPGYARAKLGLAEVLYHESIGSKNCAPGTVDVGGLMESLATYEEALDGEAVPGADIVEKATFGYSRVLACLVRAESASHSDLEGAEEGFSRVIEAFRGNDRLRVLAAESHGYLGLLEFYRPAGPEEPGARKHYEEAERHYRTALELYAQGGENPDQRAKFHYRLSQIYDCLQDPRSNDEYARAKELDAATPDAVACSAPPTSP